MLIDIFIRETARRAEKWLADAKTTNGVLTKQQWDEGGRLSALLDLERRTFERVPVTWTIIALLCSLITVCSKHRADALMGGDLLTPLWITLVLFLVSDLLVGRIVTRTLALGADILAARAKDIAAGHLRTDEMMAELRGKIEVRSGVAGRRVEQPQSQVLHNGDMVEAIDNGRALVFVKALGEGVYDRWRKENPPPPACVTEAAAELARFVKREETKRGLQDRKWKAGGRKGFSFEVEVTDAEIDAEEARAEGRAS